MKSQYLSNLYLIKLIHPKLFTILLSYLILSPKKNGDSVLLLQSLYLARQPLILTMTISMLGSSSCYTKMKICLIPGLLILTKISILTYPFVLKFIIFSFLYFNTSYPHFILYKFDSYFSYTKL